MFRLTKTTAKQDLTMWLYKNIYLTQYANTKNIHKFFKLVEIYLKKRQNFQLVFYRNQEDSSKNKS